MANSLFVTPNCSFKSPNKPGIVIGNSVTRKVIRVNEVSQTPRFQSLEAKATESNQSTNKPNSIVCASCDGNGAKLCTQCEGSGINSVDHFNGQFKAGGLCWLCRCPKTCCSYSSAYMEGFGDALAGSFIERDLI